MIRFYQTIWLCGLAASGKTTVLRSLHQLLPEANYFNDSLEILEFINRDTEQQYHSKPTPDSFILSDSQPAYYAVEQLIKKSQSIDGKKVIELSRGLDQEEKIDFSYQYFFSQLPKKVAKDTLVLYINSPLSVRLKRNQQRGSPSKKPTVFESFYCPEAALKRFFTKDDFFAALPTSPVDSLIINNDHSLNHLKTKVKQLFSSN